MSDWDDLRFLLALHRAGSLAKAAASLGVDKATVSRRIAALEGSLGVRLIERVGAGYRLTTEATPAIAAAERMDAARLGLAAALDGGDARGPVRLTLPAFLARALIIPALPAFRASCPEVELQLLTSDRLLDLARREADIAVRNIKPTQLGMVARSVGPIAYALYGAESYLEQRGMPASREGMAGHHLIAGQREPVVATGFRWLFDAGLHVSFRASDMASQHDAVVTGVGLGVLPRLVGDDDASLRRVAAGGVNTDEVYLVYPEDLRDSPRVRAVLDFVTQLMRGAAARLVPPS